jgi:hypothetical protein
MFRQAIGIITMAGIFGGHSTPVSTPPRTAHGNTVNAATAKARSTTYPLPAGYSAWWFSDPACPDSPDSFAYYVEWWNEDESLAYDYYAGHSSYYCGSVFKGQTLTGNYHYQHCVANSPPQWNCQLLYATWQTHP